MTAQRVVEDDAQAIAAVWRTVGYSASDWFHIWHAAQPKCPEQPAYRASAKAIKDLLAAAGIPGERVPQAVFYRVEKILRTV